MVIITFFFLATLSLSLQRLEKEGRRRRKKKNNHPKSTSTYHCNPAPSNHHHHHNPLQYHHKPNIKLTQNQWKSNQNELKPVGKLISNPTQNHPKTKST